MLLPRAVTLFCRFICNLKRGIVTQKIFALYDAATRCARQIARRSAAPKIYARHTAAPCQMFGEIEAEPCRSSCSRRAVIFPAEKRLCKKERGRCGRLWCAQCARSMSLTLAQARAYFRRSPANLPMPTTRHQTTFDTPPPRCSARAAFTRLRSERRCLPCH